MKTFIMTLGLMAALAFAFVPGQVLRADDENGVSFQTFYNQLSDQGTWIQTSDYGYVWQPTVNDPNWRPYMYGHWANTDSGMMWISDEPFGWATYHYGRWVNLDGYGWVWVPGYTWAPAWVSWRESDDYCGWAPLPPDTLVGIDFFDVGFGFGFGFHIGDDCDLAFGIGPACYNFCPVAYIGDPYCWRHFAPCGDNFGIIGRTRNVTNINVSNDPRAGTFARVHEGGPALATLNAHSRTPIRQVSLTSASTLASNDRMHGNSLSVYAPKVDPSTVKTARPQSVAKSLGNTSVNRGTNINKPLAVNSHIKGASPTSQQIHAASLVKSSAMSNAKVATANTQPSRALKHSLTSLHGNVIGAKTQPSATTTLGANLKHGATGGTNANVSTTTTASVNHHVTTSSSAKGAYTGETVTHHATTPSRPESAYTGESVTHHVTTPSSSEVTHTSVPTVHHEAAPSSPMVPSHMPPIGSSSRGFVHPSSAPEQHFENSAPAPHFSGGNFGGGAPAPHFGGGGAPSPHFSGGGGGGHPSGGGGGGGHPSGGGGGGGHGPSNGGNQGKNQH